MMTKDRLFLTKKFQAFLMDFSRLNLAYFWLFFLVNSWLDLSLLFSEGSPDGSITGYLPWLISCRLLQLNPGAWGEHLTSQLTWAAAWLLVTDFRKGRNATRFQKVRKTSEKEKWRNPFSVASNLKARRREIAGKIQNISKITNHINHKTRVYVINRRVSTSLF